MIYGSVCSGIEAATMAWHPLGWSPAFFSEIEAFPSSVLAHHYGSNMPGEALATNGVPNLGDMTKFEEWPEYAIDLLVGGTPCQSFSVAGLRKGLDDPRGNLMLTFGAIAQRYRPSWVVWENVPGVLSDDGGRGFASLLGLLSGRRIEVPHDGWRNAGVVPGYEGAYGLAWRVLDAQFIRVDGFGRAVPQRRRRVFVVGYSGDWRRAAAVLLEREGMCGDTPPRRESGKNVAPTISSRPTGGGGLGTDFDLDGGLIADEAARCVTAGYAQRLDWETENFVAHEVAGTMKACTESGGWSNSADHAAAGYMVAHTLRGEGFDASEDGTGRGTPLVPVIAKTLTRGAESAGKGGYAGRRQEDDDNLVAYAIRPDAARSGEAKTPSKDAYGNLRLRNAGFNYCEGYSPTLDATASPTVVHPMTLAIRGRNGEPDLEWRQDGTANAVLTPNGGRAGIGVGAVAIQAGALRENPASGPDGIGVQEGIAYTLEARSEVQAVQAAWAVRRLTPTECHRLQGFTDGFCNIPWRGKDHAPDGPQYKALGNSMAVNVMRWIGRRIEMVDQIMKDEAA